MNTQSVSKIERGWGDAAVDGLLAGVVAGGLMAVYVLVVGLVGGTEWTAILAQFDPGTDPQPLTGALTHLAVAGVYGAIFGIVWRLTKQLWPRLPGWLAGLVFGLALWGLATAVTASGAMGDWMNAMAPVHFLVAHGVYGLVIGVRVGRTREA
jgi:hypothetical protein